ncbi:Aste57867_1363 [Aphanomyces stellatus]|uniref:Aste57867_1363 protein n=1 Tax=Aphanomyces stellatus TaxID=120398 RepID=A0A485K8D7_9STRA|nr:hypothetical protein As57867_001362 [Aphanomyces stellatus]VFT78582.1 Aste57867_1363 [Aphanomyces stellatus]
MQTSGEQSAEVPKQQRNKSMHSIDKTMLSSSMPPPIEIEECTPVEPVGGRRERRQSVELVYGDMDDSPNNNAETPSSPKKGTCVVHTRCTDHVKLCLCEVKRHKDLTSCWLVSGGVVYDVTSVIQQHPAGTKCILRKAGGMDCTQDLRFHSKDAQRCWKQCAVGKLLPCGDDAPDSAGASCAIM